MTQPQRWTGVGRTETGHVRVSNQDALALLDDCGVWMVADGMGGCPAGDVAAQTAVAVATQRARARASWLHEHPSSAAEFMMLALVPAVWPRPRWFGLRHLLPGVHPFRLLPSRRHSYPGGPMHPGSTHEHARFQFVRPRSIAGVASRRDLNRLLEAGR